MTEILSMRNVRVGRKEQPQILQIESLTVKAGELIALVGPNGAGKSTLLRTINLLHPFRGEIQLFGETAGAANALELRRRSAMVFQDTLLLDGSVYDNVAWPLRFRGWPAAEVRSKVRKALADFGCDHLELRPAKHLSGGESQRVCIARALVSDPELLLLDEPFAALDATARTAMIEEIRTVAKKNGITILMVSHHYPDVLYFAERAVAIFSGQILQDDLPQQLLRRPFDERVARLAGIDNILPCAVRRENGQPYAILPGGVLCPLPLAAVATLSFCCLPGDVLELCDGTEREAGQWVVLTGVVDRVIPAIGMWCVLFRLGDMLLSARLPRTNQGADLRPGEPVAFRFHPQEAQFV